MNRRRFLGHAFPAIASLVAGSHVARAQSAANQPSPTGVLNMDGDWYKPIRPPPRANPSRLVTPGELDAIERTLACPCPCTHDVFTCRTVDPTCTYAAAIHRDLMALVIGGYSADEIKAIMRDAYGDSILMVPSARGFSVMAWLAPAGAIAGACYLLVGTLRQWQRTVRDDGDDGDGSDATTNGPTPDELARITHDARDLQS